MYTSAAFLVEITLIALLNGITDKQKPTLRQRSPKNSSKIA